MMKHRILAGAFALALSCSPALAQGINPGSSPLSVPKGGTGAATLTTRGIIIGHGTAALSSLVCTTAQLVVGQNAADPLCKTITGDVTIDAAGATAIGATKVTNAMLNADVFSTAHTWSATQTTTINQNAATGWAINNTSAGTSAYAGTNFNNGTGLGIVGTGGTGYTQILELQNRAFLYSQTGLDGIAFYADGAKSTRFYNNGSLSGLFNSSGFNGTIGATTPAAGTFTGVIGNSFVPNLSTVPSNGMYLPAANTLGWAINSASELQLTSTAFSPAVSDGNALGTSSFRWGDLFGASGFVFDIAGDWIATHSAGIVTVGTGDFRVTNAGTNSASAVTVGGTQTLTSKTLTSPSISGATLTGVSDNQGTLKLSSFVTSTQITSNQNNYTATDGSNTCTTKTTLRVSSDASRNVTGLSCSQAEGDIRIVHNVGAQNMVFTNQDTNSTAANRFLFGGDVTLIGDSSFTIRYDGVTQRWRAITTPSAGGGGGVTSVGIVGAGLTANSGTCTITTSGTCTLTTTAATQSDQETGTSTTTVVVPGRQHYHKSAAKAWVSFTGSTGAVLDSYNVTSVTRNAAGDWTITWTTNFSSANYACSAVNLKGASAAGAFPVINSQSSSQVNLWAFNNLFANTDPTVASLICFGDQ